MSEKKKTLGEFFKDACDDKFETTNYTLIKMIKSGIKQAIMMRREYYQERGLDETTALELKKLLTAQGLKVDVVDNEFKHMAIDREKNIIVDLRRPDGQHGDKYMRSDLFRY